MREYNFCSLYILSKQKSLEKNELQFEPMCDTGMRLQRVGGKGRISCSNYGVEAEAASAILLHNTEKKLERSPTRFSLLFPEQHYSHLSVGQIN